MERDIDSLADPVFDLLVVGGGIVGACAAWEASLRGLRVALVEREDFGSGTSANSLKIIHGGLRHLQSFDVKRARRSIRERSAWLRVAPHLVEPLPFLLPLDGRGRNRRAVVWAGLRLYDLLARDRNRDLDPSRRLPRGRLVSRSECADLAPGRATRESVGGALFSDGLLYDSERLVLEVVMAADGAGAAVANYAEFVGLRAGGGEVGIATIRDRLGQDELEVATRAVVDASGPWSGAAGAAASPEGRPGPPDAARHCVALNLVTDRPAPAVALGVESAGGGPEPDAAPRRLFLVPWRGQTLVGTGYYPDDGRSTEEMAAAFLRSVNRALPELDLRDHEVKLVHRGRLPLAPGASGPPADALLGEGWIRERGGPGPPHVVSAGTVKYTTGRWIAQRAVDRVCRRLGEGGGPGATLEADLPGTPASTLRELTEEALARPAPDLPDSVVRHLVRGYGRRYPDVLRCIQERPGGDAPVVAETPVTVGELAHAAAEEMAVRPDDLLFRRTEIGARGWHSASARRTAEEVLAHTAAPSRPAEATPE